LNIFQVETFNSWQCSIIAFFSPWTGWKTIEHTKEFLFLLESDVDLGLSSILQNFTPFVELRHEESVLEFLLFVLFELKSLEIECFVEVFVGYLIPCLDGVDLLDCFELSYFIIYLLQECSAGIFGIISDEVFDFLLLFILAVLIYNLQYA